MSNRSITKVFLGHSVHDGEPVFLPDFLRKEHILVLGSTGTGKTSSVIEPIMEDDIRSGRGLVFMTAKEDSDFLSRMTASAERAGRMEDLLIFSISHTSRSCSQNPLRHGDPMALRDLCMGAFSWDSPYYRDQAKSALHVVFSALRETGRHFTLKDLYYIFTEKDCLEILITLTRDPTTLHALRRYLSEWKVFHDSTRGLVSNLEDYATGKLASIVCDPEPDIDFLQAYRDNKIVIIILNSLQYGETAKRLGRMMLQNLRFLAGRVTEQKLYPVYIDEFHHFIYPDFFSMLAQCRSAGIGLTLSTQSFADLKGEGFDMTTQVIQNTNIKVILRQNDSQSAEIVAKLVGTENVWVRTEQMEHHWLWGRQATGRSSLHRQEKFVIHPHVIQRLKTGHGVLIVRGETDVIQFPDPTLTHSPSSLLCQPTPLTRSQPAIHKGDSESEALDIERLWREGEEERKGRGIKLVRERDPEKGLEKRGLEVLKKKTEKS